MSDRQYGRAADAEAGLRHRPEFAPVTGMCAGTSIMTLEGILPVEYLSKGDRIVTRDAGAIRLVDVTVTAHACRPIRVAADTLGIGRPVSDTLLAPGQRVLVRDWRARTLFGRDQALVPIARLVDGNYVTRCAELMDLRLYTLHFENNQVVYANGIEVAAALRPRE
jgi:Hint domain